jgi:putative hemolysin
MLNMPGESLDFELPADTPLRRAAASAARPLLTWTLRLRTVGELYARVQRERHDAGSESHVRPVTSFAGAALRALDVVPDFRGAISIPERGPLLVTANHPHGVLDGLLLLDALGRVRADVRLLANHLLAHVPELRDLCFFVDPFAGQGAVARSLGGLRAAHRWLRHDGALIMFPAGEVAHETGADGGAVDGPWSETAGRLALATGAQVLPAYIAGANSRLFRAAGRIHPCLRTVLLARELLSRRGRPATVYFGAAGALPTGGGRDTAAATALMRSRVEQLQAVRSATPASRRAPVARGPAAAGLARDVEHLPSSALLTTSGELRVYCAAAAAAPQVIDEIARLREVAFRAVGEGTGRGRDRDRFDDHYEHLFVWHAAAREVVGAYRLGRTDRIVGEHGVGGLYTRTLFRYDERLLASMPPAVELGRSFVRVEYQRHPGGLLLLWKGICAWIARHPRYRVLFGAVSISSRYHDRTRGMLMSFLEQHCLDAQRAALVEATDPGTELRGAAATALLPGTVDAADKLVAAFEHEGAGMPVLLRQYLKLNARLLGFNRDASFGDALDALMMVDLVDVDPRILRRYFGPAEAQSFQRRHAAAATPDAA